MKKIRNLVIGGIENKVFNLILVTIFMTALAFMAGFLYQNRMLTEISNESSLKQRESIDEITGSVMNSVVDKSMGKSTRLQAALASELFGGLGNRVEMLGDYATKLFNDPESAAKAEYAAPDPARNGEVTAQTIFAEGVDADALADRLSVAANFRKALFLLQMTVPPANSARAVNRSTMIPEHARGISRRWNRAG